MPTHLEPNKSIEAVKDKSSNSAISHSGLLAPFVCAGLFLFCVVLIKPYSEMATIDDWAYARVAQVFAQTGHFTYHGWEAAMLGWQVLWGALFIKLFGYSFLALRWSVLFLGIVTAVLLYRILMLFSLSSEKAAFGTLTVVLSPLYLPLVSSFMTDAPALFSLLVCIYGCQRALLAASDRAALMWLCGSAAINVLGGTVRQIVWFGSLVVIPSAFWLLRRRHNFIKIGMATWFASIAGIYVFVSWFKRQPYAIAINPLSGHIHLHNIGHIIRVVPDAILGTLFICLPILVGWLPTLARRSRSFRVKLLAFCIALTPFLWWLDFTGRLVFHLAPWSPNVITPQGIMPPASVMGDKPQILSKDLLLFLTLLFGLSLFAFLLAQIERVKQCRDLDEPKREVLTMREALVLLVPFCGAYMMFLISTTFAEGFMLMFDRYYLPLLAPAVILLLLAFESNSSEPVPITCYLVLLAFTVFGVAGTHDLFVESRATLKAIQEIQAAGVPPTSSSGAWQYDGWLQIEIAGTLNDSRIVNPRGVYQKLPHPILEECGYWFGPWLTVIHPQYVVVGTPQKCLEPSKFDNVPYETWLPPYHRMLLVEHNPTER
jgi:hypothetical protein